jgi:hypothetical protein
MSLPAQTPEPGADARRGALGWLALAWLLAAAFISASGHALPERVAAHFNAAGAADGYLPRTAYLVFLLVIAALPTLATYASLASASRRGARLNLPNGSAWQSPQGRALALGLLRRGMLQFAVLLLAFLCYGHWMVVRANLAQPVQLDSSGFTLGLVVFAVLVTVWLLRLLRSFRRGPGLG